jgi:isopenicillin N synthase-like dioxygenase
MVSRVQLARLPVIDLSLFELGDPWRDQVAALIDSACSEFGAFYVVGHGIDSAFVDPLVAASRRFFAAEEAVQSHLATDATATTSAIAMRGPILLPEVPGFREPVLDYMRSLTGLGHKLMAMIARGLLLQDSYFVDRLTGSPSTSFRIDDHPPVSDAQAEIEAREDAGHQEQGLLTILKQDETGGLEFKLRNDWVAAPDVTSSFICTVGDALAHLTNGRFRSPWQRVRSGTAGHRLSMRFGFDPSEGAVIEPVAAVGPAIPRVQFGDSQSDVTAGAALRQLA